MFTTELAVRILLTALVVGRIGFCQSQEGKDKDSDDEEYQKGARTGEYGEDYGNLPAESRFLSSDEDQGILLPPDDKYNFVGDKDPASQTNSGWRRGRSSQSSYPAATVVSTNSYSVRPGNSGSSGSGASVTIDTKPVSIVTTSSGYTVRPSSPMPNSPGYYGSQSNPAYSQSKNSNEKSTIFVKNNCYGSRCPPSQSQTKQTSEDDWTSYHYVLNKDVKNKQKQKRYEDGPTRRNDDIRDIDSFPREHQMTLSIPFRVEPAVSSLDRQYPILNAVNINRNNRRVSRTTSTTTTPGWVKLPSLHPGHYDPFNLNNSITRSKGNQQPQDNNSQFSNRLGVELNPDSFADRWGWGEQSNQNQNNNKASGSRLPSWLQEIHSNYKGQGGPTRNSDNKNWVKLDPIPVSGVTISKWVPKGTSTSELPTTNWQTRDRPHLNGGFNNPHTNNKNWWDHIDNVNKLNRPQPSYLVPSLPPPVTVESHHGWGPSKGSSSSWDRTPTNAWNDVIYPNGPTSATASWQQDKDMTKYASSFPMSNSGSNSGWASMSMSIPSQSPDTRRPPTPTGSWSADRSNTQFSGNSFGGNRRYGSTSYPDRNTNEDDPRWVLVSNSRKVTVTAPDTRRVDSYGYHDGKKFRPGFDKFSDFPFYEPTSPYNHRNGKDFKDLLKKRGTPTPHPISNQDDAFRKVNATLASLTPVLSLRGSTLRPSDLDLIRSTTTTTKRPRNRLPAFMKPYVGDGRSGLGNNNTYNLGTTAASAQTARKGLGINPVYAAVGAGMIPATMAAVLPMVLGRRRRDLRLYSQGTQSYIPQAVTGMILPTIYNNLKSVSNSKLEADNYSRELENKSSSQHLIKPLRLP